MIIGITGTLAAGKGTIVTFLKEKGFKHYSVRHFLIKEIEKKGLPVNRESMTTIANELRRKNSPSYIVEKLYEIAKKEGGDYVIESLRTPEEIYILKNKDEFYLFSVDANITKRYNRAILRGNESDKVDFDKFILQEKIEMENKDPNKQNLKKCIELADYKFENNGTIEELKEKIEKTIEKIKNKNIL
jgi:dephospho-CoA kinase